MTKRKRNILIVVITGVIVLLAAAVGIVYAAYTIAVSYNYNVSAYSDTLDLTFDGGLLQVDRRTGTRLTATKGDIVIITPESESDIIIEENTTLESYTHYKYSTFFAGGEQYRKSVFTDVVLTGDTTEFTVIGYGGVTSLVTGLKAQMSEAKYQTEETDDDGNVIQTITHTVIYDNIYVSNSGSSKGGHYSSDFTDCLEFELMNFQTNYNDIFELWSKHWDNYNEKRVYSRTVFLLDDVTVKRDYTINIPCSINLLASTLTVEEGVEEGAELKIAHPYAGRYFISNETVTVNGQTLTGAIERKGSGESQGKFVISTPKAYYRVEKMIIGNVEVAEFGKEYIGDILSDALDFALSAAPDRTYSTFILPSQYKTYGISFDYSFVNDDGEPARLSGRVSDNKEDTALWREVSTKSYNIAATVTADDGDSLSGNKNVKVIGNGDEAIFTDILDEIGGVFENPDELSLNQYIVPDLNIYTLLKEAFAAGGFRPFLNISVYEDAYEAELTPAEKKALELTAEEIAAIEAGGGTQEEIDEALKAAQDERWNTAAVQKEAAAMESGMPVTLVVGYTDGGALKSVAARSVIFSYVGGNIYLEDTGSGDSYPVRYVYIAKGLVTVSRTLTVKLRAPDALNDDLAELDFYERMYDLKPSSRNEVIYYLKTVMPAFLTNKPYPMLNIKTDAEAAGETAAAKADDPDAEDIISGIYSGKVPLTPSFLGIRDDIFLDIEGNEIKGIEFEFYYDKNENGIIDDLDGERAAERPAIVTMPGVDEDEDGEDDEVEIGIYYGYYEDDDDGIPKFVDVLMYNFEDKTCATPSTTTNVPAHMKLKYTVTFAEGDPLTIDIDVIKSIASEGGDNQQFESSNPFDELFMSSETVWIEGGNFTVPSTSEHNFAQIEIVSIDGVLYEDLDPNSREFNMVSIRYDNTDVPGEFYNFYEDYQNGDYFTDLENVPQMENDYGRYDPDEPDMYTFYKSITVVTHRDYVPDYNTSVRFRCYYALAAGANSAVVLRQEYLVTVNGIFKCEGLEEEGPDTGAPKTPYVFFNEEFYNITIQMFELAYEKERQAMIDAGAEEKDVPLTSPYVAKLSDENGTKILLSDSAYATGELDYTGLTVKDGVDVRGIERLKRVTSINLNGVSIADMAAFAHMYDSALETLHLEGCGLDDAALYAGGGDASYLYEIQLKEVFLSDNELSRTDKLLSRTVTYLDISNQNGNLIDIDGLFNLTSLRTLDVQNNNIYRFDVLRKLTVLERAYIHNNIPGHYAGDYGTDGRFNIPTYVAVIKDYDTRIYAAYHDNTYDDVLPHDDYMRIDRNAHAYLNGLSIDNYFTNGNALTAEMEIGSVSLNAFASPTKLYSMGSAGSYTHDGIKTLIGDLQNLKVLGDNPWTGGVGNGSQSTYYFKFYNPVNKTLSDDTMLLINDNNKSQYTTVSITGAVSGAAIAKDTVCSYMLAVVDEYGNIFAYREFLVTVMYGIGA